MGRRRNNSGQKFGRVIGGVIGGVFDLAVGGVERAGRLLLTPLHLPGMRRREQRAERPRPGTTPGIESSPDLHTPPPPDAIKIGVIDYGPEQARFFETRDIDAALAEPRPEWARVRWINIDGIHPYVINRVKETFGFHTLAAEDVLHIPQRPKLDPYGDHLFMVARMMQLVNERLYAEQISFFLAENLLVTFQEDVGDVWQPIRERIATDKALIREHDVSWLAYALLDSIVDHCFPLLEGYSDLLEQMEDEAVDQPTPELLHRIHGVQRDLAALRRVMWPMRELVQHLMGPERKLVTPETRTYLRDVYEHTIQIIDIIETFREMTTSLADLYLSSMSNRMNEVMKVLTIIATLFIPATFLAGVYGMNFEYFPELDERWAYPAFWAVVVVMMGVMIVYFRRKRWI